MKAIIHGTTLPVLEVTLSPGEKIVSEPGEFSWMSANMRMNTSAMAGGTKGVFGILKRAVAGGGLFLNEFSPDGGEGLVAFSAKVPGQILEVKLEPGRAYLLHRHGFLCGGNGVELGVGLQKSLGAGLFGGEGLVLQKLGGSGSAWVELGGEVVVRDLGAGETIQVHHGHIGMFEEQVGFDITVQRGIKNALFGGDGLFIAKLTGPGKVWLQSLTMPNLAHALLPYLPVMKDKD